MIEKREKIALARFEMHASVSHKTSNMTSADNHHCLRPLLLTLTGSQALDTHRDELGGACASRSILKIILQNIHQDLLAKDPFDERA